MIPNLPPAPMAPAQAMGNPHGGSEAPMCPYCGQALPMPFNNTDSPQVPMDPRVMMGADQGYGQPAGQPGMEANPLMEAIMGGMSAGNMR